ncbi:MAG: protein translocase SEC61 complex subunit gamma [Euryarchaeota archaeon]|jgi:protein transport protein SEC61 subunit gamma-like protein|nr:protein translocase SEC61 complex subunit gamma [Euryarchaeota archaeon]
MNVPTDFTSYIRVLKFATTPAWEEFSRVSMIAGAGIVLVGTVGFLMFVIMSYLPGGI